MRRLLVLAPLLLFAAGCIDGTKTTATPNSVKGTKITTPTAGKGDPAAGKALFTAQSCAGCHTFKAAGSTAKVGPDLDHLAADAQKANQGSLADYVLSSIKDPGAYVVPGFQNVMPTSFSSLTPQQLADLVAFLTQNQKS